MESKFEDLLSKFESLVNRFESAQDGHPVVITRSSGKVVHTKLVRDFENEVLPKTKDFSEKA